MVKTARDVVTGETVGSALDRETVGGALEGTGDAEMAGEAEQAGKRSASRMRETRVRKG